MRISFIIIAALIVTGIATMFVAERAYNANLDRSAELARPSLEALTLLTSDDASPDTATATVPEN